MKRYKITRVYRVSAETKAAALELARGEQAAESLVYEAATEEPARSGGGWKPTLKEQRKG